MDLLGGYNSNSLSDSDNDSNVKVLPPSLQAKKRKAPSRVVAKTDTSAEAASKKKQGSRGSGKKLLKLQAALLEHAWNQLSNGVSVA